MTDDPPPDWPAALRRARDAVQRAERGARRHRVGRDADTALRRMRDVLDGLSAPPGPDVVRALRGDLGNLADPLGVPLDAATGRALADLADALDDLDRIAGR